MPFLGISFTGSKISIEIIRLPDRWIDKERCRDLPRGNAFPHLHPIRHTSCADFRSCKQMHVIGHENVVAHPPAIVIGRALPDFTQKSYRISTKQEFYIADRCT